MPFNLGLGIGLPFGGGLFTPAQLFAASEAGFWGEVNTNTLWQDTARTTPVTAAGQSVASWQLNTSGAAIYATQATLGNRPTYNVDADGRGFLLFDGVDDWLETSAVNFSTANKLTLVAGARKLSDAARGVVAELTNGASNRFSLTAPDSAAPSYGFFSGGTNVIAAIPSTFASPDTAVLTGIGDIVGDSVILRRNGVQASSNSADQGTGNFSNAIVYIGRRGGTTLPFNGRIYGLIARGAASSALQIEQAEAWMNARTGAY